MTRPPRDQDQRNHPRVSIKLRVDAKLLDEAQKIDILAGNGYPDLDQESLSLSNPRRGRLECHTFDVSPGGLRLSSARLEALEHAGPVWSWTCTCRASAAVVKLLAEVMWADRGVDSPVAGLRFAALEDEGLRRLREYLEGLR